MKRTDLIVGSVIIGILVLLFQCVSDPVPEGQALFQNGVFIVNEGNYADSDGSLSYLDLDSMVMNNQVFEKVNGRPLAALFQSMKIYELGGYLIDGNGRIEIVDIEDLRTVATIEDDLVLPRYFEGYGNLGFVTDWGPYDENWANPDSKLLVLDLLNRQLSGTLDTPSRPEGILSLGERLYVANSATNLITIYDPVKLELVDSVEVNNGPVQFVVDKNSDIWVISTGAYISGGALQHIDPITREVIRTVDLSTVSPNGRIAVDSRGDLLFFMGEQWAPDFSYTENKVYKASIDDPGNYEEIISDRNLYGLGVDPVHDVLYVADAAGFQGSGKAILYDFEGVKLDEFLVGRGPKEFLFTGK